MKQENTKQRILDTALRLFSERGYDAVSVGEIADAVGIKAPSLYNHFGSKREIFDGIVEYVARRYEDGTDRIDIHVQDVKKDIRIFEEISEDALSEKVRQIFLYSLHDETVCRFRRMMTIEQFRSPSLARLYTDRYITRMVDYHAAIFRSLIDAGVLVREDPETLALMYISPVTVLIGVCDREPGREEECLARLGEHVRLFFRTYNVKSREGRERSGM